LLLFDPADDLTLVKDQFAAGREAYERQAVFHRLLPYAPHRAADQGRNVLDRKRGSEFTVCFHGNAAYRPLRALPRAMGRAVLPAALPAAGRS